MQRHLEQCVAPAQCETMPSQAQAQAQARLPLFQRGSARGSGTDRTPSRSHQAFEEVMRQLAAPFSWTPKHAVSISKCLKAASGDLEESSGGSISSRPRRTHGMLKTLPRRSCHRIEQAAVIVDPAEKERRAREERQKEGSGAIEHDEAEHPRRYSWSCKRTTGGP
jgi:hypothetical protein